MTYYLPASSRLPSWNAFGADHQQISPCFQITLKMFQSMISPLNPTLCASRLDLFLHKPIQQIFTIINF